MLPQRSLTQYVANEPAILAKDSLYLKEYINPANLDKKRQERSGTVYTAVKKGDTLGAIARRYRVTTAQLMRWNNIKSAHKPASDNGSASKGGKMICDHDTIAARPPPQEGRSPSSA